MLVELGTELKTARDRLGLPLQTVAETARISVSYLQKLERGQVDTPSPRVLHRLGASIQLPYLRLMELAGYLDKEELAEIERRGRPAEAHPLRDRRLTQEEWRAVGAFIETLISARETDED